MDVHADPASEPSLEERRFQEEAAAKKQELGLRQREVTAKEEELRRSRWLNPMVIGLFAAAIGLIGSVIVARVNNQASQQLEQFRSQSTLILQAIKTGDQDGACRNLVFFVSLGLLDDQNHTISKTCASAPTGAPSLPADSRGVEIPASRITVRVLNSSNGSEVQNLRVYYQLAGLASSSLGVFASPTLGSPSTVTVSSSKNYMIWAAKDGDPGNPITDKVLVQLEQSDVHVDLIIK